MILGFSYYYLGIDRHFFAINICTLFYISQLSSGFNLEKKFRNIFIVSLDIENVVENNLLSTVRDGSCNFAGLDSSIDHYIVP